VLVRVNDEIERRISGGGSFIGGEGNQGGEGRLDQVAELAKNVNRCVLLCVY
jgi:hypothetical protein